MNMQDIEISRYSAQCFGNIVARFYARFGHILYLLTALFEKNPSEKFCKSFRAEVGVCSTLDTVLHLHHSFWLYEVRKLVQSPLA